MNRDSSTSFRFDALEPRVLRSVTAPGQGQDLHLSLNGAGDAIVSQSAEHHARVPLPEFKWYDGTGRKIIEAGGSAFEEAYTDHFYIWPHSTGGNVDMTGEPDEAHTRELARLMVDYGIKLLVIDNEEWEMDIRASDNATVSRNIARMQQILGWIRDEEPSLKLGIYGYMSHSDVYASEMWGIGTDLAQQGHPWYIGNLPNYANLFAKWQASSEYLRPLSESVDYLFPALYARSTNPVEWERSARATIEDTRRYGKPVIPFIWPYYHPRMGGPTADTLLPTSYWEKQLDVVREVADGGYVWNGYPTQPNEPWIAATVARTTQVSAFAAMSPVDPAIASSQRDDQLWDERFDGELMGDLLLAA